VFNGILVTGDNEYPVEMVTENLGFDATTLFGLQGAKVLSVGEGTSCLLPFLLDRGIDARGLDTVYHSDDSAERHPGLVAYVKKYGDRLIKGDGRHIPLADNSVDVVVSHMVVNNVSFEDQTAMVKEAMRVAKKQARIFGFDNDDGNRIAGFLSSNYGEQNPFSFGRAKKELTFRGHGTNEKLFLLTLNKTEQLMTSPGPVGSTESFTDLHAAKE
jgi:SAM-dependent methyltransferase